MEIIVLHNQSLLDITIQHTGSVHNAFAIAVYNNIAVSDPLKSGSILKLPKVKENTDILNYYTSKKIKPATAITEIEIIPAGKGLGWMQIGKSFKVTKNE
jgi:hypothetical protein